METATQIAEARVDASQKPDEGRTRYARSDLLAKLRYRWLPDHVLGEILSKKWIDNAAPFAFLLVTVWVFSHLLPGFFDPSSLSATSREFGEFSLVVMGMMIVIAGGGIDLSVGSNFALANLVTLAGLNLLNWSLPVAFAATVASCALVGAVNGVLVGFLRLRAFLTTLVTLIIVRAVVDMALLKYSVPISSGSYDSAAWDYVGSGSIAGLPFSLVVAMVVAVAVHVFLSRTRPGWRILAVGGSRRSAHNVGLSVRSMVCSTYVISGVMTGVAGFLYAARLGSLNTDAGVGLEVSALTAAILGGNSLGGGRSSTAKALMGAVTVMIVTTGVIRLGLVSGSGQAVMGVILAVAVAIDVRWLKNRDKVLGKFYVSPTFVKLPVCPDTSVEAQTNYALNTRLRAAEAIGLGEVEGPEDVIFDSDDNLYTGTRHGDIVRFLAPDYRRSEVFCHIGGHPLGMAFNKEGDLVSCVGGMGVYAVNPHGVVRKLTDETNRSWFSIIDDSRFRLADDVDIAPDGKIYFSEATIRYDMAGWITDALEGRGNGRLICYDPATKKTRTLIGKLVFPNGVCLSHDGQSILFAESWMCRINRYWISGPKAGQLETLISDLPGYPDNINRASDGTYWLAIMGMRGPALEVAMKMPGFRKRMTRRLPGDEWIVPNINTGCIVKFNDQGEIVDSLWDFGGENHPMITSMRENKGYLYIGGITNNRVGRFRLDNADPDWTAHASYWRA
ncbi:ABC transporter permease [Paraburkholderia phosphatilytica]|uniref:ABC transporter permease n=1 Tax=Paraburkholderia phosphatilytica TaxID=2282883 RepID=UPI000E52759B|nr:SMP-30/gluconolactonase/LRE family protein [Paraburkholderia phosphatilytica]